MSGIIIIALLMLLMSFYAILRTILFKLTLKKLPVITEIEKDLPPVSVIIPARNEEKEIEKCLNSLLKQSYPDMEIIIVNDQSEDETGRIAKKFAEEQENISVIDIDSLPKGWMGKCNASYTGATLAKGEWLLFSDADVYHCRYAVVSAVLYAFKHKIDFLTLRFTNELKVFWEKIIMPYMSFLIQLADDLPSQVNNPDSKKIKACGDFMLIKADAYRRFGGHSHPEARFKVPTDMALAKAAQKNSLSFSMMDGTHLIRVRKFHNLFEAKESIKKIFSYEPSYKIIFFSFAMFFISVLPLLFLLFVIISRGSSNTILYMAFFVYGISLLSSFINNLINKYPFFYAILSPLAALFMIYVSIEALIQRYINKNVTWRGRQYPL
ncbi:MAG: glycosyltransferase [Elusimicrobiota bacterium]